MTKQFGRKLALAAMTASLFSMGAINASTLRLSGPLQIPQEFTVHNAKLPAGEYRVEQDFGKQNVVLVNTKTQDRVYVLRGSGVDPKGQTKVRLVQGKRGLELKLS